MRYFLFLCLILAACASPSLEFQGASKVSLSLDGDVITVFHTATSAQAIRTNYRGKAARVGGVDRLIQAIETVTKCKVNPGRVRGDAVLITAALKCPT